MLLNKGSVSVDGAAISGKGLTVLVLLPLVVRRLHYLFFFSSRRRHTRLQGDWSSDVCSSDLYFTEAKMVREQPVPFSHKHHVSGIGIDCRYCHTSVEDSSFAGIPPTKTCMNRSEERRVGKECRSRWSPYH